MLTELRQSWRNGKVVYILTLYQSMHIVFIYTCTCEMYMYTYNVCLRHIKARVQTLS